MGARAPPRTAAQGRGRPRRRAPRWRGRRGRRAVGSWFPCRFTGERCRGAETLAALTAAANALSCARRQRRCDGGDMAGVPFDRHRAVVLPEWIDYNGHMNVDYRSEEHTSELQSLMRISYAVFCLKKKNTATDI